MPILLKLHGKYQYTQFNLANDTAR